MYRIVHEKVIGHLQTNLTVGDSDRFQARLYSRIPQDLLVEADVSQDDQIFMDFEGEPEGMARTGLPDMARPLHSLDP
jgi:hypothetical protein